MAVSLLGSEEVLVHRHPHVRVLVRPAVIIVVVVGLAGLLVVVVSQSSTRWGVVAVAAVVLLATATRPVLHWLTTTLTVTDRRLLLRSGVLARYGRDIPLGRIDDVSFEQTLLERMLGCGTLYVELGADRDVIVVQNVPRVAHVHAVIYELLEERLDLDEFEDEFESD
ncbi:PH domain-containing protein [Cryptosporangium phraense]|uniref:PH domain-containing protein n=1 Tax=Cryptosporangium phraense TaxID=2593070 RepID=A0A545AYM5_9ACTN|nr:PH domain-containing protein [Cryptosporangium phraense]TQS46433.1 PH domain-containing protein [Cryptosporangium phraense]